MINFSDSQQYIYTRETQNYEQHAWKFLRKKKTKQD